jgi:large subunit ribosomal protein L10
MTLNLDDKKVIVESVNKIAATALSAVVADYRGLTVSQMTALRNSARKQGVFLRVVRNTLARRALIGTQFSCLDAALVGPTILAFSLDEPSAAARMLKEFSKQHEKFSIKALSIGGQIYPPNDIDRLATLPTKIEATAMLARVLQEPISKFARSLNEVPSKLARSLNEVKLGKIA